MTSIASIKAPFSYSQGAERGAIVYEMPKRNINTINSFLILVSLGAAWFFPFELFLLAYAILGPLHYLTEIHWLHKKDYFVNTRYEPFLLVFGGTALFALLFSAISASDWAKVLVGVFLASLVMVMPLARNTRATCYLAIALLLLALPPLPFAFVLFSIFLPTLVHVYIFTGAFMLLGALKERSQATFMTFALFLSSPFLFLVSTHYAQPVSFAAYIPDVYRVFTSVNHALLSLLGKDIPKSSEVIYQSLAGIAVMKFIAFAYFYHYLNWFSKTKIIRWSEMTKKVGAAIILLWLAAVALYFFDYRLGFFALYLLSMWHVLLELPLNNRTFASIWNLIRLRRG